LENDLPSPAPRPSATRSRWAGRESFAHKKERAEAVYERLGKLYPGTTTALHWQSPFQLLVATILSAQCTDDRVNQVTPRVFKRWPTPASMAQATQEEVEEAIHSTGFYRNKAKNLRVCAQRIESSFHGEVPSSMEELLTLAGVARKTANCVMGTAFNNPVGVVVDTHVGRLARRLGFTKQKDPVKVEHDLMKLLPREAWTRLSHLLIDHGRAVCTSRKANCDACFLASDCPKRI